MSRLGKKPIVIPEKTTVVVADGTVKVVGPLGEITKSFRPDISVKVEGAKILLKPLKDNLISRALWGTYASHLRNMVSGVNGFFKKILIIEGIGFKAEVKGEDLVLSLGFTHPIKVKIPKGLKVVSEKGTVTVSGIDKELVGRFAAEVRALKKPEPYKGKGIRYEGEIIKRKQGKKTV